MKLLNPISLGDAKPAALRDVAPGGLFLLMGDEDGEDAVTLAVCAQDGDPITFACDGIVYRARVAKDVAVFDLQRAASFHVPDLRTALRPPGVRTAQGEWLALRSDGAHVIYRRAEHLLCAHLSTGQNSQVSERDWYASHWQLGFTDAHAKFVPLLQFGETHFSESDVKLSANSAPQRK